MTLIYKLGAAIGAALILAALFVFGASSAKADGYEGGSYKDEVREYRDSYRRSRSYVAKCDRYLSAWECRRFRAKMAERANGGYREPVRSRRVYAETRYEREPVRRVRYAESRRYSSDVVETRSVKACQPTLRVTGEERGWRDRAYEDALDTWRRNAISEHGLRYGSVSMARGLKENCGIVRKAKWGQKIWACSISARPCREM